MQSQAIDHFGLSAVEHYTFLFVCHANFHTVLYAKSDIWPCLFVSTLCPLLAAISHTLAILCAISGRFWRFKPNVCNRINRHNYTVHTHTHTWTENKNDITKHAVDTPWKIEFVIKIHRLYMCNAHLRKKKHSSSVLYVVRFSFSFGCCCCCSLFNGTR